MAIVYEKTLEELEQLHLAQVRACIRNRLWRLTKFLRPWSWGKPTTVREWVTWDTLVTLCSRPEGFTVARDERGQEYNYRLVKAPRPLAPERHPPAHQPAAPETKR